MAAAVGRGRSRAIRGTRQPSPASTPTINSPTINSPSLETPPSVTATPAQPPPQNDIYNLKPQPKSLATGCINILKTLKTRDADASYVNSVYTDCINCVKVNLTDPADVPAWLEACVTSVYGDRVMTQEFVKMLCAMQKDETVVHRMEVLRALLRFLQSERDRLQGHVDDLAFTGFVTLLAEVAQNIKKPSGAPLNQLSSTVLECVKEICKPRLPEQVYDVVYHVMVRYGKEFEEHLRAIKSQDTTASDVDHKVDELYDTFRAIVIDDTTSDSTRLLMLEVIERRAYGYNVPEACLRYYQPVG